jgi:hypothetical protein
MSSERLLHACASFTRCDDLSLRDVVGKGGATNFLSQSSPVRRDGIWVFISSLEEREEQV